MKKIIILALVTIFITSCTQSIWQDDNILTISGETETNSGEIQTNLQTNTEQIMDTFQTKKLEDWDVVAIMKTTNGTITLKLFTELVPATTANFIGLSKQGYYKDVIFHRVIKDFMIQWGDPDGTWMWGTSIYWEKFDDEFSPELTNIKYSISMANAWVNTNGSQFFINEGANNFLDNKHSVFGQVVEWFETVDKISKVKTDASDRPEKEVKIISIEIKEYKNGTYIDYDFDLDSVLKEVEEANAQKVEETKKIEEAKAKEALERQTKAIEAWFIVSVDYTWTFEDWEKFDSSLDRGEPIEFQVWAQQMIKWFDDAVIGMKLWEKKSITLEPQDAYWEAELTIPKTDLQSFIDAWIKLEAWEVLPTAQWEIVIKWADETSITIDNNHPLAWKVLNFEIEIVGIK